MACIRYDVVSTGVKISVDAVPTYWIARDANIGILWEETASGATILHAHGRVGMIVEAEMKLRRLRKSEGQEETVIQSAYIDVSRVSQATLNTLNGALAGTVGAEEIVSLFTARAPKVPASGAKIASPMALAA
jgi:hypothetical protein